ncbi:MAG: MBL fold metallo-hydrolase [Candidatus Heimdallarchaeaceae archaeon]
MALTQAAKLAIIISCCVVGAAAIITPTTLVLLNNDSNEVNFTLLHNAGVMIETDEVRIYVDPYNLPSSYSSSPADIILITHPHGDHYDPLTINLIKTDDTLIVCPDSMTDAIATYGATGVDPEDNLIHMGIDITAFYMYTEAPEGYEPSHHPDSNWTSYIIDVGPLTFFHAGDSANIFEYTDLTGLIDVALLPLGPGCQTMVDMDVVFALDTIKPTYFTPIHFATGADTTFCSTYANAIGNTGCELIHLDYYQSHLYEITS